MVEIKLSFPIRIPIIESYLKRKMGERKESVTLMFENTPSFNYFACNFMDFLYSVKESSFGRLWPMDNQNYLLDLVNLGRQRKSKTSSRTEYNASTNCLELALFSWDVKMKSCLFLSWNLPTNSPGAAWISGEVSRNLFEPRQFVPSIDFKFCPYKQSKTPTEFLNDEVESHSVYGSGERIDITLTSGEVQKWHHLGEFPSENKIDGQPLNYQVYGSNNRQRQNTIPRFNPFQLLTG